MSPKTHERAHQNLSDKVPLFVALGDETRCALLVKLGKGGMLSITHLAEGSSLTRQAVRKHLQVLERVGLVRGVRRGRENLFQIETKPLNEVRQLLEDVSQQWDRALARLKALVEGGQ